MYQTVRSIPCPANQIKPRSKCHGTLEFTHLSSLSTLWALTTFHLPPNSRLHSSQRVC
jgi:hypothetical protein